MYQKKWPAFTADLLQSFTRIQEHANMVCLQEVAKKVWDLLSTETSWVGYLHSTQKFGIMWNPEVWKINLDDSITKMRVCPNTDGKMKIWREQIVVAWEQKSILYAVGCTHTIDGKGGRKLPEPDKMRIADVGKSPCINAGFRSPRSDSDS